MQDHSAIFNRLKKNLKARKALIKNESNAYRLYDRDIPEYPFIIDIFDQTAVSF